MSETLQVGKKLVEACRKGDWIGPYKTLYSDDCVNVEGADMPNMPATTTGKKAVLAARTPGMPMSTLRDGVATR
jgi:hypothetical protein